MRSKKARRGSRAFIKMRASFPSWLAAFLILTLLTSGFPSGLCVGEARAEREGISLLELSEARKVISKPFEEGDMSELEGVPAPSQMKAISKESTDLLTLIDLKTPSSRGEISEDAPPELPGWEYRTRITINNILGSEELTDYQVLIVLDTASPIAEGKMREDGADIRFTDAAGNLLPYWIESGINTEATRIWVKVPSIPASSITKIYLHYGNPEAEPASDIEGTLEDGLLLINKKNTWGSHPGGHEELAKCVEEDSTEESGWFGWSFVDAVHQDENIHGNDDYYTSYYEGFFYVETPGTWQFATDSDDASEIEIDGLVVASWYGSHGAAGNWSHYGSIELDVGWHKFVYRQEEMWGGQGSRAAFKDPDDADWRPFSTSELLIKTRKYAFPEPLTVMGEDTTAPQISEVAARGFMDWAGISWQTDELANGVVLYGTESGNYTFTARDLRYTTSHRLKLQGLEPGKTYYFVVESADLSGNTSRSPEYSFTTTGKRRMALVCGDPDSLTEREQAVASALEEYDDLEITKVGVANAVYDTLSSYELVFLTDYHPEIPAEDLERLVDDWAKVILLYDAGKALGGNWGRWSSESYRKLCVLSNASFLRDYDVGNQFLVQSEGNAWRVRGIEGWTPIAINTHRDDYYTVLHRDESWIFAYDPCHMTGEGEVILKKLFRHLAGETEPLLTVPSGNAALIIRDYHDVESLTPQEQRLAELLAAEGFEVTYVTQYMRTFTDYSQASLVAAASYTGQTSRNFLDSLLNQGLRLLLIYEAGRALGGDWAKSTTSSYRELMVTDDEAFLRDYKAGERFTAQAEGAAWRVKGIEGWIPIARNAYRSDYYTALYREVETGLGAILSYDPVYYTDEGKEVFGKAVGWLRKEIEAHARTDRTACRLVEVTLDASASWSVGTIVSYEWDLDGDGEYDDASGMTITHTWDETGEFEVGLRVIDDAGRTATDVVRIIIVPNVDLVVSGIAWSPESFSDGDPVTFTATVENRGIDNLVADFEVRFMLDGRHLGRSRVTEDIPAGGSISVTQTWTATVGMHTITAAADYRDEVFELDENNNALSRELAPVDRSDLVISEITCSPTEGLNDGDEVIITATVRNLGPGDTSRDFWVRFEVDERLLGRQKVVGGLKAGEEKQVSQIWLAAIGRHTVKVIADGYNNIQEANEENNALSHDLPQAIAPDLTVSALSWTPEEGIRDGESVTLTAAVQNIGDGSTLREFNVRFEVDGKFIGRRKVAGLASGELKEVSLNWIATPGTHTVKVVVDERNEVAEREEANNELSRPFPEILSPNLVVAGITWSPEEFCSGETVSFTVEVKNAGPGSTLRDFRVRLEIDGDFIGREEVSGLEAGESAEITLTWVARPGKETVRAVVDERNAVAEADEADNELARALPEIPAPDLVVTDITAPERALSGERIEITWTIVNRGDADTVGTWTDAVYLSDDQEIGNDRPFGRFSFGGTIPAGGSVVRTQAITLPMDLTGERWVVVQTDIYNEIYEDVEDNNAAIDDRPIEIEPYPFPNLQVSEVTAPPTAFSGQEVVVEWTVVNVGAGPTATPTWYDGIWLSLDTTLDNTDTFLGEATNASYLGAGESYTNSKRVTLPRGIEGSYYFIVRADRRNQVGEGENEGDNIEFGGPVQVQLTPPPDLQVDEVNAPAQAFSGQTAKVEWTVINRGPGPTAEAMWYDEIFLSEDEVLDEDDRSLGRFRHDGALEPGETYGNSVEIRLPIGISGDFFIIVCADARDQVFEHAFEGNNTGYDAIEIKLTPPPDLEVVQVDAPQEAKANEGLIISYRVANNGATETPNARWTDAFYLSADEQLNPDADMLLGTRYHRGALDPGESYEASAFFTLPVGFEGTFYVFVVTDSRDEVFEAGAEENNIGFDETPVDICACPPDLQVVRVDAPEEALANHDITISYRVANNGQSNTRTSYWRDAFYLSPDAELDTRSDIFLGTRTHKELLDTGEFYEESVTFTIPADLSGPYYVFVLTDERDQVFEGDNEDNNAGFDPTPVNILSRPPDLTVLRAKAPGEAEAGKAILVSWTVVNQGTGDTVAAAWTDRVYASTDEAPGRDILLASFKHEGLLDAGESYSRTELVVIPFDFEGQYYLFIRTDAGGKVNEGDREDNNCSPPLPLTVARPTPDLQVARISAPAATVSEESITVEWTVKNTGENKTNVDFWHDDVFLSQDTIIDPGDVRLGSVYHSGALEPGDEYSVSGNFTIPRDLSGDFYLIVRADGRNRVAEGMEDNNDASAPISVSLRPVPDLVMAAVDAPAEAISGQPMEVTWTVRNDGADTGGVEWHDAFYLSRDQVFDRNADTLLGVVPHDEGLAAGGSYTKTHSFRIPSELLGHYYLFAIADGRDKVYERGGERNNINYDAAPVLLKLTPPADLAVGAVTIPANAVPGEEITITYTVENRGANPAKGSWYDSLYISSDEVWDINDELLGHVLHRGDVPGGSSYTETLTAPLPGIAPGDYFVIVRSDIRNHVPESDEGNNFGASLDRVEVNARELALGVPAEGSVAEGRSAYYRVEVPAGETLLITLDAEREDVSNELYVRYGDMPSRTRFDYAFPNAFSPDQQIVVRSTRKGTYYILVYGDDVPTGRDKPATNPYTIEARLVGFSLLGVKPDHGSNRGKVTLTLTGSKFTYDTEAYLIGSDGIRRPASRIWWKNSNTLWATFDLRGLKPGRYDVVLEREGKSTGLSEAFTVNEGPEGELAVDLSVPSGVRPGQLGVLTLSYVNRGETDIMAPLIAVSAENAELRLPEQEAFAGSDIQLLGIAREGPAGILSPGNGGQLSLIFRPTLGEGTVYFAVEALSETFPASAEAINWDELEENFRPLAFGSEAWEAIWRNFTEAVGETARDYLAALSDNATHLSLLGVRVADVRTLLSFELAQADGLNPLTFLAGAVDATVRAPGLSLTFARLYPQSLSRRLTLGSLGWGWFHSWDLSLVEEDDGTVVLCGGVRFRRIFKLSESGGYISMPGDRAILKRDEEDGFILTEPDARVFRFFPDGKLDYIEDKDGNRITAFYDVRDRLVKLVHSSGQFMDFVYDENDRIIQVIESTGRRATFSYDPTGEHLIAVTDARGHTTRYTYFTEGPAAHFLASVDFPDGTHLYFTYDERGRLTGLSRGGGAERLLFAYDSAGAVTVTDALGASTKLYFDQNGIALRVMDPLGRVIQTLVDENMRITQLSDGAGYVYTYKYDEDGNLVEITDPLGHTASFTYEGPFLTSMRDPRGNVTAFSYDERGHVISRTFPDGSVETYSFDRLGNLTTFTNRRGQTVRFAYDDAGRLISKTYPDGSESRFAYDERGNLISAADPTGTITFTYDDHDRLIRITYPGGLYLEFTYDERARRTSMADHLGNRINYHYDEVGRLARLTDENGKEIVRYTYDAAGRLVRKDLGNGVYTIYEYNPADDPIRITNYAPDGSVLSRFVYAYNISGKRISVETPSGRWTYTYDGAGQLTNARFESSDPEIPDHDISYYYDPSGNRIRVVEDGVVTSYTVSALNQYTRAGDVGYAYDADGNLIRREDEAGVTIYSYDPEDRLISIVEGDDVWTYTYNALGVLSSAAHNGEVIRYLADPFGLVNLVGEYDAKGNLIARYDYGYGLIRRVDGEENAAYYTFDALGSVSELIGPDGEILGSYVYGPFGELMKATGEIPNPFRFVGEYGVMIVPSDLYFMRMRFYSPELGQFLSEDPVLWFSFNNRVYVGSDPVLSIDPMGLRRIRWGQFWKGVLQVVTGGITFVVGVVASPTTSGLSLIPATWGYWCTAAGGANIINAFYDRPPALSGGVMEDIVRYFTDNKYAVAAAQIADLSVSFIGGSSGVPRGLATAGDIATGASASLSIYGSVKELYEGVLRLFRGGQETARGQTRVVRPADPNDIVGPPGFGDEHWVTATETLPYTIRFENRSTATAPAQVVTISQFLDEDLDWRTFRVGSFGWGDVFVEVPEGRAFYSERLDLRETHGFFVDVTAGIDIATGEAYWTIATIDPETGEVPEDPMMGFLPPNDESGRGQGFVTYTIKSRRDAQTGAVIDARARIVFDTEEPLDTPPIFNTIDAGAPSSAVEPLPERSEGPEFTVRWSGSDDEGGSGLASFTVYVSDNGSEFVPWLEDTTLTEATFIGEEGHVYAFYSVARDNAGNVEEAPAAPDARIMVPGTAAISGRKFHDLDEDGVEDESEPGLEGWIIYLDLNGNGSLDEGEPTAVTDAAGNYAFTGLASGTYIVAEVPKPGWRRTCPAEAYTVELGPGEEATGLDFGNAPVIPGDVNQDGVVNELDIELISAAFKSVPGAPNWNFAADLNGDGIVDIYDLVLAGLNFGEIK